MSIIRGYGLFWRLDWVRQHENYDFYMQGWLQKSPSTREPDESGLYTINRLSGVYALQNEFREILYVGQTSDFGNRLWTHTRNSNRGKWSRFSWFSLDEPILSQAEPEPSQSEENTIESNAAIQLDQFEGLLIQLLDPKLNKRAANWKHAKEYIQSARFAPPSLQDVSDQISDLEKRIKKLKSK